MIIWHVTCLACINVPACWSTRRFFKALPTRAGPVPYGFGITHNASLLFVSLVPHCPDGMNHFLPKRGFCYGFYDLDGSDTLEHAKEKCLVRTQTAMIWMS